MEKISAKEILKKKVSLGNKCKCESVSIVTLKDCLFNLGDYTMNKIREVRKYDHDDEEYGNLKSQIPIFYVCGTFKTPYSMKDDDVENFANLITLDIDKTDQDDGTDLLELQKKIFELPYVFCCYKSVGGKGLFAIIPVEDGRKTKEYIYYLYGIFKDKFNIVLDLNATNIARKRICSYDENYRKFTKMGDVSVFNLTKDVNPRYKKKPKMSSIFNTNNVYSNFDDSITNDYDFKVKCVEKCITLGLVEMNGHDDILGIAKNLYCLGEKGHDLLIKIFKNSNYSNRKSLKDFNDKYFYECEKYSDKPLPNAPLMFYSMLKTYYGKDWVKELKD